MLAVMWEERFMTATQELAEELSDPLDPWDWPEQPTSGERVSIATRLVKLRFAQTQVRFRCAL